MHARMGKLRDAVAFIIRPWASVGTDGTGGRWTTIGGGALNDEEITDKSALAIATYFACIRNIGEDIAKLPFCLIKNDGKKRIRLDDDPLTHMFAMSPNPTMTAFTFISTYIHWAAGWGNAYAKKIRNGTGRVAALKPIHPSRVTRISLTDGTWYYKVYNDDGTQTVVSADDMFTFMGMSADGTQGYTTVRLMQNTLGVASTVQRFAKNFYQNSCRPAGILETANVLKAEARTNLANTWAAMYSGPENAGKTAVLEAGVQYKSISLPMKDMEFIELRKFQKEEICSWFRMPLYKVQDVGRAQGWSTLDAQETDYVTSCLMPWVMRLEQEIHRQLMVPEDYPPDVYPHFEFKGLLRGDINARRNFYQTMRTIGVFTGNQILAMEDMDPSDDPLMDTVFIQGAMVPLAMAGTKPAPGGAIGGADGGDTTEPADDTGGKEPAKGT